MTSEQQQDYHSKLAKLEAKLTKAATLREGKIEQVKSVAAQSAAPRGPVPPSQSPPTCKSTKGTCMTQ